MKKDHTTWILLLITLLLVMLFFKNIDTRNLLEKINTTTQEGDGMNYQPQEKQCWQYDVSVEYVKAWGNTNINNWKTNCEGSGGTWTMDNSEISCIFPVKISNVDCDGPAMQAIRSTCDAIHGVFKCDNTQEVFGCWRCDFTPTTNNPSTTPPEDQCFDSDGGDDPFTFGYVTANQVSIGDTCRPNSNTLEEQVCPYGNSIIHDCAAEYNMKCIKGACVPEQARIFVTDYSWSGAIGGLFGADDKCQAQADLAGLGYGWLAFMADTSYPDIASSLRSDVQFVRIDGKLVASNKNDLVNGNLVNPVNLDQYGNIVNGVAWTGLTSGGVGTGVNCHDWGWVSESGTYGSTSSTSASWMDSGVAPCEEPKHLYCLEGNAFLD